MPRSAHLLFGRPERMLRSASGPPTDGRVDRGYAGGGGDDAAGEGATFGPDVGFSAGGDRRSVGGRTLPRALFATAAPIARDRARFRGRAGADFKPRLSATTLLPAFIFASRRASRYFLILVLGTSLCFAQTIPKIGAAGFLQPGTGQS